MRIWQTSPGYAQMELAPGNINDWKTAATSFEGIGIRRAYRADLIGAGEPRRVVGSEISADLLTTLGVHAAVGRVFANGEDGVRSAPTVILSHGLWQTAFGGRRDIVGHKIVLDEEPREDNTASMRFVTPGYFATVQTPVLEGRDVSETDTMMSELVAVVSASLAARYRPGQDVLGRRFNFVGERMVASGLVPGLIIAAFVGRTLQSLLAGIAPFDVQTFGAVIVLTMLMALAGTLIPTLRAVRVDPIKAMRTE